MVIGFLSESNWVGYVLSEGRVSLTAIERDDITGGRLVRAGIPFKSLRCGTHLKPDIGKVETSRRSNGAVVNGGPMGIPIA